MFPTEKRKVGGSTPPLTTSSEQRERCDHCFCGPGLLTDLLTGALTALREDLPDAGMLL